MSCQKNHKNYLKTNFFQNRPREKQVRNLEISKEFSVYDSFNRFLWFFQFISMKSDLKTIKCSFYCKKNLYFYNSYELGSNQKFPKLLKNPFPTTFIHISIFFLAKKWKKFVQKSINFNISFCTVNKINKDFLRNFLSYSFVDRPG